MIRQTIYRVLGKLQNMPSSYLNCFSNSEVPAGNSGNLRPEDYDYKKSAKRLIKILGIKKSDSIVDIGCGNGLLADKLISCVKNITLVEANINLIRFLIDKYADTDVKIIHTLSSDLHEISSESCDKVICLGVLQYCNNKEVIKTVKEALRICKKDGLVYFGDIFNADVINDFRDGMNSFRSKFIAGKHKFKIIASNYEPEKRYDLIIYND